MSEFIKYRSFKILWYRDYLGVLGSIGRYQHNLPFTCQKKTWVVLFGTLGFTYESQYINYKYYNVQ